MNEIFSEALLDKLAEEVSKRLAPQRPTLPRMRTLDEAAEEIRKQDPESSITPYYIRQMVLDGTVPFVPVGRKRLINFDALLDVIYNQQKKGVSNVKR